MGSEELERFKHEFPDAYFCSCFFCLDFEGNDNKQHFDYYSPSMKKIYSFKVEDNCARIEQDMIGQEGAPLKINDNHNFDFNEVQVLIEKRMELEKIKGKMQKMLFSLQNVEGKDFLIGTIFLAGMALLKLHILLDDMSIPYFEKKTFFDMFKIIKKGDKVGDVIDGDKK
jgi:hypothetical protein